LMPRSSAAYRMVDQPPFRGLCPSHALMNQAGAIRALL
jgi:hypothetical protein